MFESIVVVVPETVKFCPIVTLPEASIVILPELVVKFTAESPADISSAALEESIPS